MSSEFDEIRLLLDRAAPETRARVVEYLRAGVVLHPLETLLGTKAEVILEAIHRAGGLTLRMIRGVIAESAFVVEVSERLGGWVPVEVSGDPAYDALLQDGVGQVRVQVKLQRSKAGRPMVGSEVGRKYGFAQHMLVAEVQKTRGGTNRSTGGKTRPYRFGEFDVLAVAMFPTTGRWDHFRYTVADWLLTRPRGSVRRSQISAGGPSAQRRLDG